jgi:hypothetical protein
MSDTYGTEALSAVNAGKAEADAPERPIQNPAVARCLRAWQRAYKKAINDDEDDYYAKCAGDRAFLRCMPPLSGFDNIRDFIACVTYAVVIGVVRHKDADHLLAAAKIALATLRHRPVPTENGAVQPK